MWRKLDEAVKADIDEASAICIMMETPSIIKRPVMEHGKILHIGFNAEEYAKIFA
jgi:arsenate reductase